MERKKKRTHAEVIAAKEAYAKEHHDKLVAKEAKRAEREKLLAERAERRAAREARKNMTAEEIKADRYKRQVAKAKRKAGKNNQGPTYESYKGDVFVGDTVAIRFAGCTVIGEIMSISSETMYKLTESEDSSNEQSFRKGVPNVELYYIKGFDGYIYPIRRENIIAKKGE